MKRPKGLNEIFSKRGKRPNSKKLNQKERTERGNKIMNRESVKNISY